MKLADLTPPIGHPGGPCYVVKRIQDHVRDPHLRDLLIKEVEEGESLSNPEAAKIYGLEVEAGVGKVRHIVMGPHASYRADLRGVNIPVIRAAIQHYLKQLNDWKSRQDRRYDQHARLFERGEAVDYLDPRTGLVVVFKIVEAQAKIVTTYWKGESDPKAPSQGCFVTAAMTPEEMSGYKTLGKPPGDSREPDSALPSPPNSRSKPVGKPYYNVPPSSDEAPEGKSLHKDKVRTLGVPGGDGEHPWVDNSNFAGGYHQVRPDVTASMKDLYYDSYPGMTLHEVISNWQSEGRKLLEDSMPVLIPISILWPFREYTWTRENSRSGNARVNGQTVHLEGPLKWDALKEDMKVHRWDPKEPLHFEIGRTSGAKVGEGNHRLALAREVGILSIPVEFHFKSGAVQKQPQEQPDKKPVVISPKALEKAVEEADSMSLKDTEILNNIMRFLSAAMKGPQYPGTHKQRDQLAKAKRYYQKRYRQQRGKIKARAKKWYATYQNDHRLKLDRERRRKNPEKYSRKPGGGYHNLKDRSQDYRDKQAEFEVSPDFDPIRFWFRPTDRWGWLLGSDPELGTVSVDIDGSDKELAMDTFFDEAVFESEEDIDRAFSYLDDIYDEHDLEFAPQMSVTAEEMGVLVRRMEDGVTPPDQRFNRGDEPEATWPDKIPAQDFDAYRKEPMDNPGPGRFIPNGHGFVNKEASKISEIQSLCSPDIHAKSQGIQIKLRRVDPKNLMWLFDVAGSKGETYKVRVKALPKGKNIRDVNKTDVQVSCSCPYWRWQGPEHHAQQKGYLLGRPVGLATRPDIKDPQGQHGACKHMLAVLKRVSTFALPEFKGKTASLQYLADSISYGRVIVEEDPMVTRVASRYLARVK